jgi:hypothetical protein
MKKIALTAVVALLFSMTSALADETSSCTLFDPTPDHDMRSFSTDRPTKSDSPYTIDCGHLQYEADIVNWTYDHDNASQTTVSNLFVGDPTFKLGLTHNADFEVALAPITIDQSHNRAMGTQTFAFGFGDVYTRVKFNVFGNDGGDYALAIVPYVKAPTAPHNLGNGHWEGGGYMPFVVVLPDDWTMDITSEMDILENASLNGTHTNISNLINFGHPLFTDDLTGYIEFWSDVDNDRGAQTQYTGDLALTWLVQDNVQLDCGINIGLNKAANDVQPYLGLSQRF